MSAPADICIRKLHKVTRGILKEFPEFMKNPLNKVDSSSQYTPGIEGFVFDGADKSQMAFWTYKQNAKSDLHSYEYDEYIVIVQGQYCVIIEDKTIILNPGDEYLIPKGVLHVVKPKLEPELFMLLEEKELYVR